MSSTRVRSQPPPTAANTNTYLTVDEVAEHYRTKPTVIRYWRRTGTGPRGLLVGKHILYPRAEVERFDAELLGQVAG